MCRVGRDGIDVRGPQQRPLVVLQPTGRRHGVADELPVHPPTDVQPLRREIREQVLEVGLVVGREADADHLCADMFVERRGADYLHLEPVHASGDAVPRPGREEAAEVLDELLVLVRRERAPAPCRTSSRSNSGPATYSSSASSRCGEVLGAELLVLLDLEVLVGERAVLGELLLVGEVLAVADLEVVARRPG